MPTAATAAARDFNRLGDSRETERPCFQLRNRSKWSYGWGPLQSAHGFCAFPGAGNHRKEPGGDRSAVAAREAPTVIETLRGSADILRQTWKDIGRKDLSLVAAGVTYYLLVALFPALAALISVYGLVENPAGITKDVQSLPSLLPPSVVRLASAALRELISASSGSLGLGAIIGIAIA